ncbi:MAG TPA: cellulase family glycosylhydrolase [Fimbriimonas sp.]
MRGLAMLTLVPLLGTAAEAANPIRLHPKNPHVFLFRNKPTVLATSGEHYGAVVNLDFDQRRYLDALKRHGFNLTRTFSGTYVESWGEPWNTLNPPKSRFLAPWARSDQPGYPDGGSKFDLSRWDPAYFSRLRSFVHEAGRRGIVVEMVLFCTFYGDSEWNLSPLNAQNNVNGVGSVGRTQVWSDPASLDAQERFVRKIVGELRDFDNVYFELVNEPYFADAPKLGHPWNERIVRAIRETSPKHLVALNVNNGSQKVDAVPAGVSILNYHYASPPDAVAQNYGLNVPIAFDESGFRGSLPDPYRREAWEFFLAGGSVYSGLDWTYTVASPVGNDRTADPKLGLTDPAFKAQLSVLKRFLDRLPIERMRPVRALGATFWRSPARSTLGTERTRRRPSWTSPRAGTAPSGWIHRPGANIRANGSTTREAHVR